jgi:hypothetical protein
VLRAGRRRKRILLLLRRRGREERPHHKLRASQAAVAPAAPADLAVVAVDRVGSGGSSGGVGRGGGPLALQQPELFGERAGQRFDVVLARQKHEHVAWRFALVHGQAGEQRGVYEVGVRVLRVKHSHRVLPPGQPKRCRVVKKNGKRAPRPAWQT